MQFSYLGAKIQIIFESSKLLESFLFIFSGAEEANTTYFHSFSGAENEPRDFSRKRPNLGAKISTSSV
jgi:hypothetical protein